MAELNNRVQAENRLTSPAEQAQVAAYGRAALLASLDSALDGTGRLAGKRERGRGFNA